MILAALIVGSILTYCLGAGAVYELMPESGSYEDVFVPKMLCVIWPLIIPALAGRALVRRRAQPQLPEAKVVSK